MAQILANGLISGLSAAVLALAFCVVYLPTNVFHVALGAVYAATPFVAWQGLRWGWPAPVALAVAMAFAAALSVVCELVNHWPLAKKRDVAGAHMIASLGVYMVVVEALALIWGSDTQMLPLGEGAGVQVQAVLLSRSQLISGGAAIAALGVFYVVLWATNAGLRLRALADNRTEFGLRGYSIRATRLLAFAGSGLLVAVVALTTASDVGFDPGVGLPALLVAVAATVIGGRTSFLGPALGGLLVGLARAQLTWHFSGRWQDAFTFAILVLFLFLRPNGLIGRSERLEAVA